MNITKKPTKEALEAEKKIIELCETNNVYFTQENDKFNIIPRKVIIRLNAEIPEGHSQKNIEEQLIQLCNDNNIKYSVKSNSNGSKIVPKWIDLLIFEGSAIDEDEENLIRRYVHSGEEYNVFIQDGMRHYEIGSTRNSIGPAIAPPDSKEKISDKSIKEKEIPHISMPDIRSIPKLKDMIDGIENIKKPEEVKESLLIRIMRKTPLVKSWLAAKDKKRQDEENRLKEKEYQKELQYKYGFDDEILKLAGVIK